MLGFFLPLGSLLSFFLPWLSFLFQEFTIWAVSRVQRVDQITVHFPLLMHFPLLVSVFSPFVQEELTSHFSFFVPLPPSTHITYPQLLNRCFFLTCEGCYLHSVTRRMAKRSPSLQSTLCLFQFSNVAVTVDILYEGCRAMLSGFPLQHFSCSFLFLPLLLLLGLSG